MKLSFSHFLSLSLAVIFVVHCGGEKNLNEGFRSELEGSWKLAGIRCDAQESQILADGTLTGTPGVKSWVKHTGHEGYIIWDLNTCTFKDKMESVEFQGSQMQIKYAASVCDGSTCGSFAACLNPAHDATLPYELSGEKLVVTIPLAEFNGAVPCGPGQTTGKVQFLYDRYTGDVPAL
jgi:hypothetical protein